MKIQIIGYSGAGKSTLAQVLGDHYQIPVLHLDNVNFQGDWTSRPMDLQQRMVRDFLEDHQDWVIDGNYHHLAPERFAAADLTIFLDYSRPYCLYKAWQRYRHYKGRTRESCNSPEKFDLEFVFWILWQGRTKSRVKQHQLVITQAKKGLHFKNVRQLHEYLTNLGIRT